MVAIQRLCQRQFYGSRELLVFAGPQSLEIETFVNAMDFFVIYNVSGLVYGNLDSSVAVEGVFKGYLSYHRSKDIVLFSLAGTVIHSADRYSKYAPGSSGCYA